MESRGLGDRSKVTDGATTPPKASQTGSQPAPSKTPTPKATPDHSTSERPGSSASPVAPEAKPKPSDEKPTDSSESNPESSGSPADASTAASVTTPPTAKGPRYEAKAMKKWLEENPEDGAALLTSLGVLTKDTEAGFIKLANKRRKVREELTTREKESLAKVQAEKAEALEAKRVAEEAVGSVRYMADMWQAATAKDSEGKRRLDFDTIDEAFRQNTGGMTIDEYARARARRGVSNPESAALKAENARLLRELEAKTKGATTPTEPKGAAASAPGAAQGAPEADKPAAAPAGPKPLELWGPEVPKTHGLRKFDGWADDLHTEMQRYYDETTEEYSVDPEDVANKLLEKKLAELAPVEELEDKAPRRRPATPPAKRPVTPKTKEANASPSPKASFAPKPTTTEGFYSSDVPPDFKERERRALERAEMRRRGELVD